MTPSPSLPQSHPPTAELSLPSLPRKTPRAPLLQTSSNSSIVASFKPPFGIPNFNFSPLIAFPPSHKPAPAQTSFVPSLALLRVHPAHEKNNSGIPHGKPPVPPLLRAPKSCPHRNQSAAPALSARARSFPLSSKP